MKYDKEDFLKIFDSILEPNTIAWNPRKYEWMNIENVTTHFEPALNADELSKKKLIEEEMNRSWGNLKEEVFKCLDIYMSKDDYEFLKAFIIVSKSFQDLWKWFPFDWHKQLSIVYLFRELDLKRFEKLEWQLWFMLYSFTKSDTPKEDFLVGILHYSYGDDIDFPYPDYYKFEVEKLFDMAEFIESGEYNARLSNKFFDLLNE